MATKKKLLQAAAGSAGGAGSLDIPDLFSTFLYSGNSSAQTITNGIALADGLGGGTATSFDGVDDFLSRSSDLTGNADGKTFTFSSWVIRTGANTRAIYPLRMQGFFYIEVASNGRISIGGANTSGSQVLDATTATGAVPLNTWTHILVSVDLTNTSNRYVYINDVVTSTTWSVYSNQNIDFTKTTSHVNSNTVGSFGAAIHSNIYLDYTYRDLSQTSNRRIFIDADGGSTPTSTLSALNPIVYLPMTDAYSVGKNLGTGGDYTVNGSPTIVNNGTEWQSGYGEGGLWWLKVRSQAGGHLLYDSTRATGSEHFPLFSNATNAEYDDLDTTPTSTGFTINSSSSGTINETGLDYTSWTWRKASKFFTCLTYVGNNTTPRNISHDLGSVPGMIIIKCTETTDDWVVYHRGLDATNPEDYRITFNGNFARESGASQWAGTAPTSTEFTIGNAGNVNASNKEYVVYLFAHNDGDGDFGPDSDQDIIRCGSYVGDDQDDGPEINLGFEPQWLLVKNASSTRNWVLVDNMRGISSSPSSYDNLLYPNTTAAEDPANGIRLTATGFKCDSGGDNFNGNGHTMIYMAIRRGPLAPPEDATEVFDIYQNESTATVPAFKHPFPVDLGVYKAASNTEDWWVSSRLIEGRTIRFNTDNVATGSAGSAFDYMDGWFTSTSTQTDYHSFAWKRAPNFFDCVCYTGTGANRTVSHNLNASPDMIWCKSLETVSSSNDWAVYCSAFSNPTDTNLTLNTSGGQNTGSGGILWNSTAPTDSVFSLGTYNGLNQSGKRYIAYLFSTLAGVSKVGSYAGSNSDQTIDCGFTAGARFVLIKNISRNSDWIVLDSVRGIVSGTDPFLRLNDAAAQNSAADYIDPDNSGFIVTGANSPTNQSGDNYIFYAIA